MIDPFDAAEVLQEFVQKVVGNAQSRGFSARGGVEVRSCDLSLKVWIGIGENEYVVRETKDVARACKSESSVVEFASSFREKVQAWLDNSSKLIPREEVIAHLRRGRSVTVL